MTQALVFDFDGLILDTEVPDYQAWREIYQRFGAELPLSVWATFIGSMHTFDPYDYLEQQSGRAVDRETIQRVQRRRFEQLLAEPLPMAGVEAYLEDAQRLGLRLAIASSSPRDWVAGYLDRLGLTGYFESLSCGDEVRYTKPDPAVYQLALERLGVAAEDAVALEDSPNGVQAAQRAGIFCVAVPNALTGQLSLDHADLVLAALTDLPLQALLDHVKRIRSDGAHA
jgi:HAD superfamily hydrolase (TIGR01509 family)